MKWEIYFDKHLKISVYVWFLEITTILKQNMISKHVAAVAFKHLTN